MASSRLARLWVRAAGVVARGEVLGKGAELLLVVEVMVTGEVGDGAARWSTEHRRGRGGSSR